MGNRDDAIPYLVPAWGMSILADRDGYWYVLDGDRSELVTRRVRHHVRSNRLHAGIYREADRPNVTWLMTGGRLCRLDTVPATPLRRHGPYRIVRKEPSWRAHHG